MKRASHILASLFLLAAGTAAQAAGTAPKTPVMKASATPAEKHAYQPELVRIPGGEFLMGDDQGGDDEKPAHKVVIKDFLLMTHEVTVAEYRQFVAATGYVTDAEKKKEQNTWKTPDIPQKGDQDPVVYVSWNDAMAFCAWIGARLPTEAEWEYAAGNGPKHTRYQWGNDPPLKGHLPVGNVGDDVFIMRFGGNRRSFEEYVDGYAYTAPVKSYPPNEFGLYDMTGNVHEWLSDWYDKDYYANSPHENPRGPETGKFRVIRGGSWMPVPGNVTVTFRNWYDPGLCESRLGFRPAKDAPQP